MKRFRAHEVVRVVGKLMTIQKKRDLEGEIGIIMDTEDVNNETAKDFLVGFNSYGEVIVIPAENLESLGRIAEPGEFVSRSRTKG